MKNLIKYTIKNLNKEKVLKEILKVSNITNIKILEQEMTFCVSVKNSKKIDKILDSKGAKILNKKRVGTIQFLKSSVFRLGVLIPIIVFLFAAIVSNLFVFNYQITGNDLVSSNEIINILKEQNVSGIKYKKDINISNLENAILKIEQVSLVSIIFYGNTLIINIKEKVYNEEYVQQGKFLPLKAEFNGIITEISLIQGTLLVKEGQTVKEGQELVAPYVIDTNGQMLSVKPMADIKANVFFTTYTSVPDENVTYEDTQNSLINKQITLFNVPIYLDAPKCSYAFYRIEETNYDLTTNLILPFKCKIVKYIEQQQIKTSNYFLSNKESILNDCKQKTRQFVKEYEIIKEEYYNIDSNAGINNITYTIVVNKSIC